jgi:hypothetical protein
MTSKPQTRAGAAALRLADDLERRLAPFAATPKRRSAARKKATGSTTAGSDAEPSSDAGEREDERLVLQALAGQAATLRETMVADLERLAAIAGRPAARVAGDDAGSDDDGSDGDAKPAGGDEKPAGSR